MTQSILTLFTSPKAFSGHAALIQNNALDSWGSLPGVQVILFGNDAGVAEAAAMRGFMHVPAVNTSAYGTPLLDDIFAQAREQAETPLICFVNADIILPPDFVELARRLASLKPQFLAVGQRWNIPLDAALDFSENAYEHLESIRLRQGELTDPVAMDFFLFPKGLALEMPPFCIGRPVWDNWMIWNAKQRKVPVIDLTAALTVYHQDHAYGHIPGGDGRSWLGSPEADHNYALVAQLRTFRPILHTTLHADLRYTANGLQGPDFFRRAQWDFVHYYLPSARHCCGKAVRLLRSLKKSH